MYLLSIELCVLERWVESKSMSEENLQLELTGFKFEVGVGR